MESCVANPINTLIKLFVLPSNLISKRHDKLLDFHSAQSAFDRCKEPNSRQVKRKTKGTFVESNSCLFPVETKGETSSRSGEKNLRGVERSTSRRATVALRLQLSNNLYVVTSFSLRSFSFGSTNANSSTSGSTSFNFLSEKKRFGSSSTTDFSLRSCWTIELVTDRRTFLRKNFENFRTNFSIDDHRKKFHRKSETSSTQ